MADPAVAVLLDAKVAVQERLIDRIEQSSEVVFRQVVTDPSDQSLEGWRAAWMPTVIDLALAVAAATDAFYAAYGVITGTEPQTDMQAVEDKVRANVNAWIAAPLIELRARLAEGLAYDEAFQKAVDKAVGLSSLEGSWADVSAAEATSGVGTWRRVPNPGACGFCRVVADRIYTDIRSVQLHRHCRCSTMPYSAATDAWRPNQLAGSWPEVIKEDAVVDPE